jgi:RNA polymerase sigma factor (sigma-70 family)
MEVSALKYSGGIGLHGRTPLLRLQSDDRLIALLRKGNTAAFEVLVARYETRLMAFCRHLLGSREDAEDVLQEVMTAAFNAILADDRPINVRPWLYRIARNRSLNHLRRNQAIGVDSMDQHFSENGATTADKVHEREEFRLLVGDIHELPETQKTALVLREMDAMSYEQIAEAMETTVPSVKSLLVRARVSLAEAAEARLLSCGEVRIELAEVAEGLQRRPSPLVRRHLRSCKRCSTFRSQLKQTNKALAALMPIGPLAMLHKLAFLHLGHSAGAGSTATAAGAGAAGSSATAAGAGAAGAGATGVGAFGAGTTALAGGGAVAGSSGFISAGIGALAGKAAAGLAAAALVTAGAVEAGHSTNRHLHRVAVAQAQAATAPAQQATVAPVSVSYAEPRSATPAARDLKKATKPLKRTAPVNPAAAVTAAKTSTTDTTTTTTAAPPAAKPAPDGRTQTQSDPTVLQTPSTIPAATTPVAAAPAAAPTDPSATPTTITSLTPAATTPTDTTTGTTTPDTTTTGTTTTDTTGTTTTGTATSTTGTATTPTPPATTTPPPPATTTSTPGPGAPPPGGTTSTPGPGTPPAAGTTPTPSDAPTTLGGSTTGGPS